MFYSKDNFILIVLEEDPTIRQASYTTELVVLQGVTCDVDVWNICINKIIDGIAGTVW